jgi:2-oxoglutarate/2-oxoacid ferredoxin oxidoreductase subunit beta
LRIVLQPPESIVGERGFDFCPGCGYGTVLLALADAVAGMEPAPVFFVDIGCVDFMTAHMPGDTMMGPHGRVSALASGYKRVQPQRTVCAIQGDGAFMGIGATESLYTAVRGEPITIVVLNNGVLADTGGQLAPTTLAGQVTTTSPHGRSQLGAHVPFVEMISALPGVVYAERVAIDSQLGIRRVRRAIGKALAVQQQGSGLSIVEVVSPCPTHWRIEPVEAWRRITDVVSVAYPSGVIIDRTSGESA